MLLSIKKLVDTLNSAYKNFLVRLKHKQRKPENTWINSDIIELCPMENNLWKLCKENPDNIEIGNALKELRNRVTAQTPNWKIDVPLTDFIK